MRDLLLIYITVFALCSALFLLLSFNTGFGYVYVQWHGFYIQTNLLVILLLIFIIIAVVYSLSLFTKLLFQRYLQKYQMPKSFYKFHPYERLGILWLLHAERSQQQHINQTYQQSYVLRPLMKARLALALNDTSHAKEWLKAQPTPLFELAELLKIEIALAENDMQVALDRLEFLSVQPLSSWLFPIENSYKLELQAKWVEFAQTYPWQLFYSTYPPIFDHEQRHIWLKSLLTHTDIATDEDWEKFKTWYAKNHPLIALYEINLQTDIVKLMSHTTDLNEATVALAEDILNKKFIPEILYIWLGKQFKQHTLDIKYIERKIMAWQNDYPAQPSLTFAHWHLLMQLQQYSQAKMLLSLYPDDPYMAYLRLKHEMHLSDATLNDLKIMMLYSKQDFNLDI